MSPQKKFEPGINHIEFWVENLKSSLPFYHGLFKLLGWKKLNEKAFSTGTCEIYFVEQDAKKEIMHFGPRHICFQAIEKSVVDKVYTYLQESDVEIIRGPATMNYSKDYYTVDFKDPSGFIIEVAFTPNMVM